MRFDQRQTRWHLKNKLWHNHSGCLIRLNKDASEMMNIFFLQVSDKKIQTHNLNISHFEYDSPGAEGLHSLS